MIVDPVVGFAALLSAVLGLVNLAVFAWAGGRYLRSVAAGQGGGLWGGLLMAKFFFVTWGVTQLCAYLPPLGVGLGLAVLIPGALLTGAFPTSDPVLER